MKHSKRTLLNKLDFITSVGYLTGGDARERAGLMGKGPVVVINDLCIQRPHAESRELQVASVHPGVDRAKIAENAGWEIRFSERCGETEAPPVDVLNVLRELKDRTAAAHGVQGDEA